MATTLKKKRLLSEDNKDLIVGTFFAILYCSMFLGVLYFIFFHVVMQ